MTAAAAAAAAAATALHISKSIFTTHATIATAITANTYTVDFIAAAAAVTTIK